MGEIAELVLEGILCSQCGSFIDEIEVGYPRLCEDCDDEEDDFE